jgi:cellulase (glycosyl hydrolase family 5)/IPT/TIG domain-containing protein/putative Ig domain-containing protein
MKSYISNLTYHLSAPNTRTSVIHPFHLHRGSFALLATFAAILAVLGLSSCTGHTSAAGTSPGTPSTAGPAVSTTPGLVITTSSLPSGQGQAAYTARLGATGGTAPYSWNGIEGSLPPGLTLNASTGDIAGAPTKTGAFSVTMQVTDSAAPPQTATQAFSMTISASGLQITTSSLPGGAVGVGYSATLAATNGVPPYTWSVHGGQLPSGLSLQGSNGQISGTPSQTGAFSFSVQARDSAAQTASSNLNANIASASSPIVSSISPASGPTSGGTLVTVSGSNFHAGATVLFGGSTASSVIVKSATQIQAVTPIHIAGTMDVTVRNADSESSTLSSSFVFSVLTPTVNSVSPNSGSTGGRTTVTITGTNFQTGALVLFGTVSASTVTVNSGTQIQAVTAANAAGAVDVTVEDPGGQSNKMAGGFTYVAPSSNGHYDGTVRVSGKNFVNGSDQILKLAGVNAEYFAFGMFSPGNGSCVTSQGDSDYLGHVSNMAAWKVNVVRLTLDEDCWLDINGVVGGGATYRNALQTYVNELHNNHAYVVLCLFEVAPGGFLSYGAEPLPDADHSPTFWNQVAAAYKNDAGVMFDLWNEPNNATWNCWINGGAGCGWDAKHNVSYSTAGAQTLVNTIRAAGAVTQPILVDGIQYATDMSQWVQFKPTDPSNSIAAEYHIYSSYGCGQSCYSAALTPILNANIPVMTGELGDFDCTSNFSVPFMNWADQHGVQYMTWVWRVAGCAQAPSLITDYNGTPNNYGAGIKAHFIAINP